MVQRTPLRSETEVEKSTKAIPKPEATVDAQATAVTSAPVSVQRALGEETVTTETRTLEEPPTTEEALDLLGDGDLAQLAREIFPIVKRLLQAELERRSQPDLDW
jgi:hypothetical protein